MKSLALAPLLFGMTIMHWGNAALWLTAALGLLSACILHGILKTVRHQ